MITDWGHVVHNTIVTDNLSRLRAREGNLTVISAGSEPERETFL